MGVAAYIRQLGRILFRQLLFCHHFTSEMASRPATPNRNSPVEPHVPIIYDSGIIPALSTPVSPLPKGVMGEGASPLRNSSGQALDRLRANGFINSADCSFTLT